MAQRLPAAAGAAAAAGGAAGATTTNVRTAKSCAHRYQSFLMPGVRHPSLEPFTEWEEAVIVMVS